MNIAPVIIKLIERNTVADPERYVKNNLFSFVGESHKRKARRNHHNSQPINAQQDKKALPSIRDIDVAFNFKLIKINYLFYF